MGATTNIKVLPEVDYRQTYRDYLIHMPGGLKSCDYWFIQEEGVYHAFYLESQENTGNENEQSIGHLVSSDFLNWDYCGTVLRGYEKGIWPERHLATGSVVKYGSRFYMLYTGHSCLLPGLGLAVSDDLYSWKKVGNGPVISGSAQYEAAYEGKTHICKIMADPYIYPQAIDGYYYAYVNSWAIDLPKNSRGCQLMFRSADLVHWESYKIAILTDNLDRLETCQVWERGGKWYMYFGGRRVNPTGGDFEDVESGNYIYMADCFDGPFLPQPWSSMEYHTNHYCYIQKQIKDPWGEDVALVMSPYDGVLWPYKILYGDQGEIRMTVRRMK